MKSWKGSYLLLYRVSHFKHICIHSAVPRQTRLHRMHCVSNACVGTVTQAELPVHPTLAMQAQDALGAWIGATFILSLLSFSWRCELRKVRNRHFDYINKHRTGCYEQYIVNRKMQKPEICFELTGWVASLSSKIPSSHVFKTGIWNQVPCVAVVILHIQLTFLTS
jgi:hypothetical protein